MNIIVVGAGIIGCAVAHELAARGARVHVVDPREPGQGATRASAAILAPYIEGHAAPLLTLGVSSLALYDAFMARVQADAGHQLEYERTGTLQVALDAAEAAELAGAARTLEAAGVAHQLLDADGSRSIEPAISASATAALLVPDHGYTAAGALTAALAQAARNRGAAFTTAQVDAIEPPQVRTSGGTLTADAIVVAAGSWASRLGYAVPVADAVKPMRGQLLQLRGGRRPASRVIWGSSCYLVPWRDGTVLAGATMEDAGFDERATAAGVKGLLDAAVRLLPELAAATFDAVRVGLRPKTADELPAIGRSSTMPGLFYAVGHFRNGVLLAPLTAAMVADLVLDGREWRDAALVGPERLGL